ncbi:Na(+)/H(+) antiporter subunit C [Williamsia sterculiae]|uniref:Multisubunit sodium/proton antiporter, MrpC subunit n=1 Tax=Williamsia sterculiae TaxID=1344003 RepID=A0A1N7F018_9NOCA|nr:Na(+)/H(+) antiporter subunit C [Williamsia sterculiae]SIR93733.1 multisubunit sodium/proton antiporter, MrpC subunit [Williamsia sterculiae]
MSVNLGLLVVAGLVAACGVYLVLERSLIRMLLGLLMIGNALNVLIITVSGAMGNPPIIGRDSDGRGADADPLAQGMVLTAIVISMGVAAFVLSMAYRSFVINTDDEVDDDPEDVKLARQQSLSTAPDRDRSDNPQTLADTPGGDMFDEEGNRLSAEQVKARRRDLLETDVLPAPEDTPDDDDPDDTDPDDGADPEVTTA